MDKEEKLCVKILQTLREMLDQKECFNESVSAGTLSKFIAVFKVKLFLQKYVLASHAYNKHFLNKGKYSEVF